jgi:hypothetical protein
MHAALIESGRVMKEGFEKLGSDIEAVGSDVKTVGSDVKAVGSDVKELGAGQSEIKEGIGILFEQGEMAAKQAEQYHEEFLAVRATHAHAHAHAPLTHYVHAAVAAPPPPPRRRCASTAARTFSRLWCALH